VGDEAVGGASAVGSMATWASATGRAGTLTVTLTPRVGSRTPCMTTILRLCFAMARSPLSQRPRQVRGSLR